MTSILNRVFSLALVLIVPVFFMACEGGEDMEDEGALSTPSEGYEDVPTESEPMTGVGTFTTWDTDTDAALTEDEFTTGLTQQNVWTRYDADADDALNAEEFEGAFSDRDWYNDGLFAEWDADGDGDLAEDEWEMGLFAELDANDDDSIQEDEFEEDLFEQSL